MSGGAGLDSQHGVLYRLWYHFQHREGTVVDRAVKVRENRLRRWADRLGLSLHKSRVRNVHFNDEGGYCLVDPYTNTLVEGVRFELSLDDVEWWLAETEKRIERERR